MMVRTEADGLAQDPNELFDVMRADGVPTGKVKTRAEVHRDGDWHRSVHVWVTGIDAEGAFVVFQRRGSQKDTWPGRLDATVGGHFRHGEVLEDVLREVEEEIGVRVEQRDLLPLGVRLCASEVEEGIRDREIQELFLFCDNRPLTDYTPHHAELDALVSAPINGLLDLFSGQVDTIVGAQVQPGRSTRSPVEIRREDFIPTIDNYFYRVTIAAKRALAGESHVLV